ncbi:LiaI-LiaF-like domain-containing protein [Sphingobacterium paucimobilis]|uniref:LiaI-LiaF-like transmembrane region domain-containing protein n=1 Tax=Sphingobacterium paucimobilis HER1398 TaxID=1346330 RepID=U2HZF0_9SPHI|nr:DUF5668 domain-containing protein [Sphingobacterium paucimobilis]ERJ60937.1 hypothetical protein M472_19465 [Sphingobacterium paucimobilis HER1398]
MKGKISTGIWFIFFGIIALLHNFDVIDFNFWALIRYWPLLIIAIGANLIFQNRPHGIFILSAINICLCLFLGYKGMTSTERFNFGNHVNYSSSADTLGTASIVEAAFVSGTERAALEFNIGASSITLDRSPSTQLLKAASPNGNVGLKLEHNGDSLHPRLELSSVIKHENNQQNKIQLALHESPIWDLTINMGAASFTGDFSKHKIEKMEINAGAASLKLTFDMPQTEESNLEINTAASSCEINIPKDAACRLEMESILTSKKFEGFHKKDDAQQTDNYDTASNKYIIKITGAANSLKINRY